MAHRIEHDSLGEREVPADVYYGVQTLRALENFAITGIPIRRYPTLVSALGAIKGAAARANRALGLLDAGWADTIAAAALEVQHNELDEHFVVDVLQGGAGTSTNMNANEVVANRALELRGLPRGAYRHCHPNNHVNLSQSTNDVYPTALKIAAIGLIEELGEALGDLRGALADRGEQFRDVLKLGRTQLQDAVPMTLGQQFDAWAVTVGEDVDRLHEAAGLLHEINMGATAIGTGLNTVDGYAARVRDELEAATGLPLVTAPNLVEATSDAGAFVQLSGVLKRVAVKLGKIGNDLRLLSSGPRAGLGEIRLPAVQPGSTIMPGKVNPVIVEAVNQVCFQVIGNDLSITLAAGSGQLELNAFEPLIGYSLFESLRNLARAVVILRTRCIEGIEADAERCRELLDRSIGVVTALVPLLGYERAAELAREALRTGQRVAELARTREGLGQAELDDLLDPAKMTHPRAVPGGPRHAGR